MSEHDKFTPEVSGQDLNNGLPQSEVETLYILGDPRGVATLPENVEYDVREVTPFAKVKKLMEQIPEGKPLETDGPDAAAKALCRSWNMQ